MDTSSKANLFEKYGNGTITDQELLQLHSWYLDYAKTSNPQLDPKVYEQRMEEMDNAVLARLSSPDRNFNASLYIKAAAFLLIALSITFYFRNSWSNKDQPGGSLAHDAAPGGSRAKLILANGKSIDLSNALNGELARQAGVKILKNKDGQLTYQLTSTKAGTAEYNTIEIPKGGQYGVCLPDGTKVWLNAASTLRYPATFSSLLERRVVLNGEAYFEVIHNEKQPFVVETAGLRVKDIGTKFNINSYTEEPEVKTTLLEGSAAIGFIPATAKSNSGQTNYAAKDTFVKIVKAGQQAVSTKKGIAITAINADESISWKNGFFQFQNDDIETGMRQIARWYNVDIVYEGPIPADKLDGKVYRNINLSKVLEILLGSDISYKIENHKVTIMSKK
jgi:transmembrane sensor